MLERERELRKEERVVPSRVKLREGPIMDHAMFIAKCNKSKEGYHHHL
jgi:hypothetical protein